MPADRGAETHVIRVFPSRAGQAPGGMTCRLRQGCIEYPHDAFLVPRVGRGRDHVDRTQREAAPALPAPPLGVYVVLVRVQSAGSAGVHEKFESIPAM